MRFLIALILFQSYLSADTLSDNDISGTIYKIKNNQYLIGMQYIIQEKDTMFYVYQAEQYQWTSVWVLQRRIIVGIGPFSKEILVYMGKLPRPQGSGL